MQESESKHTKTEQAILRQKWTTFDKIRCKWKIRGNIADIAKMKDKCAIYRDNKDGFVSRTQMVKELRGALQGGIEIESLHREDIVEILKYVATYR